MSGDLLATNVLFRHNLSTNGIGGALRSSGSATISNTQFLSNTAQGDGGGAFLLGEITLSNVLFQGNQCTAGTCDGGGLFSFSNTSIQETQFVDNVAQDDGGGVAAPGVLTITNTLLLNNQADSGGGLFAQDQADLYATQFLSNTAHSNGGGAYVFGDVTLAQVLFQNNQSTTGAGGGLHVFGAVIVDGSRFLDNAATRGGGLYHTFAGGRVVNSLFAGNLSTSAPGAAMALGSTEVVEVIHATIVDSGAGSAAAIDVLTGTVGITNTIVVGHAIGISNSGGFISQDYNLFYGNGADTQGAVTGGANSFTADPLFLNPAAGDYHLDPISPAIDAAADAGISIDFDGDLRPLDGGYDIGFDEVPLPPIPPTPTPSPIPTAAPGPSPTPTVEDYRMYLPFTQK